MLQRRDLIIFIRQKVTKLNLKLLKLLNIRECLQILKLALNIIICYFSSPIFWNSKAQVIVQYQMLFVNTEYLILNRISMKSRLPEWNLLMQIVIESNRDLILPITDRKITRFYLPPTRLSTSGIYTCLYSPAAHRYHTLIGSHFPSHWVQKGWVGKEHLGISGTRHSRRG